MTESLEQQVQRQAQQLKELKQEARRRGAEVDAALFLGVVSIIAIVVLTLLFVVYVVVSGGMTNNMPAIAGILGLDAIIGFVVPLVALRVVFTKLYWKA